MVTTTLNYTDSRYRTKPGEGYDGVVRVSTGTSYATGVLLHDGRAILTAAHLFDDPGSRVSVLFETSTGSRRLYSSQVLLHPNHDPENTNHDLAIVWLSTPAPLDAPRYDLYRLNDEVGQAFTLVGYGRTGTGSTGSTSEPTTSPIRLKASNRFDAGIETLKTQLGSIIAWSPAPGTQLVADFDDGGFHRDALGRLIDRSDTGLGADEGFIAEGDSGSPAFIQGRIAGIASYTTSLSRGSAVPDIDSETNSSFGEIAAWQRLSQYQQWIDQSLRQGYLDAPRTPEEVRKSVPEGNGGTTLAYFMLQFTGVRSDPNQILSVDFATRDGTARAGSDYIATSGALKLYPGENQAVIPVEIIGDTTPEPNEYFYLDVFNPVGGSFGPGVVQLTAVRTILDDDGGFG